ncbi:hypothetical protein OIC43_09690 [Streptomyces sp. NBC_00825]|uniref:hypothetical protein n=1 Tax=unclassified Streptomyces TaxID=2593676 RepID=UPI002ED6886C|nr:hypothetical protein OG832_34005 [Streptomyces sp. NBC_00826]WTH89292.1 hypothetical protein OIC43_09690 [Streptomyces sp. NBC_00825]WTH98017.1 hypothetical protein OHA23_09675 [Streptomyces sp. NBC_00822]
MSNGLKKFAAVPEREVADRIVAAVRREHPACGVTDGLLEDASLVLWDFGRKPCGHDRATADAVGFAYATPDDRVDALTAALDQYSDATARIKAQAVEKAVARLDAETT